MPEKPNTNLRDAVILGIITAITSGGFAVVKGKESIEVRISVIEARTDILWESEKARLARQLGEMR